MTHTEPRPDHGGFWPPVLETYNIDGRGLMSRNLVTGEYIGQDRQIHSWGPVTEQSWLVGYGPQGQVAGFEPSPELRFYNTVSKLVYELHTERDGHVTVTCHCARCEAERSEELDDDGG